LAVGAPGLLGREGQAQQSSAMAVNARHPYDLSDVRVPTNEEEATYVLWKCLETHVDGYSRGYWDDRCEEDGLEPLADMPVPAAPLAPLLRAAQLLGHLGNTNLRPGALLYRSYGPLRASDIVGYDPDAGTLTLDRITSFTPLRSAAEKVYGLSRNEKARGERLTLLCVTLPDPKECVFNAWYDYRRDTSAPPYLCSYGEVQLLPGVYRVCKPPRVPTTRVPCARSI
jgi:hypothetical protein